MAYTTLSDLFKGICDAIRAKKGTSGQINHQDIPNEIESIELGVDTSDATATASTILSGITAYAKGQKITGNITSKSATNYTPTTSEQTIASGQYLSGTQTILGDSNFIEANIKSGVTIWGKTGTYEGEGSSGGAETIQVTNSTSGTSMLDIVGCSNGTLPKRIALVLGNNDGWTNTTGVIAATLDQLATNTYLGVLINEAEGVVSSTASVIAGTDDSGNHLYIEIPSNIGFVWQGNSAAVATYHVTLVW